ncbi:uncharacterized protein [Oryza sativa Japonica Group]|uniref:uncharacterized protein n=1 Tax=Oryza sativa subsp. japonica TaxID=39947 RepID=UPI0007755328|nr:uncharacterized protein LOC107275924 isoform X2 [Oryza sativa Japonica Group]
MAALRPTWSPPHLAVTAAPTSALAFLPLISQRRRLPSPAPARRIQLRSHCTKSPTESEPEHEDDGADDEDAAARSEHPAIIFQERLDKFLDDYRAALGLRTPPDMFRKEKYKIAVIMQKMYSSSSKILNADEKEMVSTVCRKARLALDLASEVMDVAAFGLGTTEISQRTADQMVRTYTTIFCEVANELYHNRVTMENILSFLDALGGLGAITHILVQDTVDKLHNGLLKKKITHDLDALSHKFDKEMNILKDNFKRETRIDGYKVVDYTSVNETVSHGVINTELYVSDLVKCRRAALPSISGLGNFS